MFLKCSALCRQAKHSAEQGSEPCPYVRQQLLVTGGLTFVPHADEERARQASEHEAVQLAVVADSGHVHDRQQLLNVVGQDVVE